MGLAQLVYAPLGIARPALRQPCSQALDSVGPKAARHRSAGPQSGDDQAQVVIAKSDPVVLHKGYGTKGPARAQGNRKGPLVLSHQTGPV